MHILHHKPDIANLSPRPAVPAIDEIEIAWQSYQRVTYVLQSSTDLVTWAEVGRWSGDGTMQSVVYGQTIPRRYFRMLELIPEGSEPFVRAIVAFSGSHVLLEWNRFGPAPGSPKWRIERDGQVIATLAAHITSYNDTAVQPNRTYTYAVKYFAA